MKTESVVCLNDVIVSANTGLDAIKRAPIVDYDSGIRCLRIQDISQEKDFDNWGFCKVENKNFDKFQLKENDIIIARTGATIGVNRFIKSKLDAVYNNGLIRIRINEKVAYPKYIYYCMQSQKYRDFINSICAGTSTQPNMKINAFLDFKIFLPSIKIQRNIVNVLGAFDDKIENNNAINDNLEQQVMTLYTHSFVDSQEVTRKKCCVDEYFNISIGKTPPRKEPQWFSNDFSDIAWVSISDMGRCGLYITNSSEYLTREAIEKHNVKIVPDNTVILSFKLTVGRVAITNGEMATNEAIAHFNTDKPKINEYLYCYLKSFSYQALGSTSSIATAVNSKIIKGMAFIIPNEEELESFHAVAEAMFAKIKANQAEIYALTQLRDSLLQKLMSGEFDILNIDI